MIIYCFTDTGASPEVSPKLCLLTVSFSLTSNTFISAEGTFPDYEKLIPKEAKTVVHFDTVEAGKAISSLKVLADSKSYPIDITLDNGLVMLSSPDDKGRAVMPADIEGEVNRVRIDGKYLADALKACSGMVDLKLTDGKSPVLFQVDGYLLVTMPMLTNAEKPTAEPKAEPAPAEEKPKRKRKVKEPVAV
jgi:DNA polymerase III sliding clamp (beta) subunit (PCNA family)